MKLKKLFFGALAGLAFAACSSDDETMQVTDPVEAVKGNAYIAVRLSMVSDAQTRAWNNDLEDNYETGSEDEVGVTDAQFFFFNEDGTGCANPYYVNTSDWKWSDGNSNTIDKENNLIDSKLEGVIVLSNATTWPVKMVAVLNPTNDIKALGKATTLNGLATKLGEMTDDASDFGSTTAKQFLMSNAVYYDLDNGDKNDNTKTNTVINASVVTKDNIKETEAEAKQAPVTVYVERVLAKVRVKKGDAVSGSKTIKVKNEAGEETDYTITVDIDGWWLDNTNKNSYLIKDLSSTYSFEDVDAEKPHTANWWTDAANFRSYWANALHYNDAAESTNFLSYKYSTRKTNLDGTGGVYCFENTNQNNPTQLVVTATLKVDDEAVNLVSYGGSYYMDNTLRILLASENSTVKKYYKEITADVYSGLTDEQKNAAVSDTENSKYYQRITSDDLQFVHDASDPNERYYSVLDIMSGTYYTKGDGNVMTQVADNSTITADFKNLGQFKFWNSGRSYFYLPINQYADVKNAKGVIRNHIYELTISNVAGLGTPVPSTDVIINPQYPEADKESHLAARVAILKYRVIKQNVDLNDPSTAE